MLHLCLAMALLHLPEHLSQSGIPAGEQLIEQRADVGATQQRSGLVMEPAFL